MVLGKAEVSYGYDASGNYVTSITDPLGHLAQFSTDMRGNLTSLTDANANLIADPQKRYQTTFAYDMNDRMTSASYPYQATQGAEYTASAFSFIRDKNGNLTSIIDPYGTSRRFTYNELDQIKTSTIVSGGVDYTTTYAYDLAGNLTQIDAPDTVHHMRITYDTDGRPKKVAFLEGNTEKQAVNYTYDANGNPLTVNSGALTYTMIYDELNRMTNVSESADVSITHAYENSVLKTDTYKASQTSQWSTDYTYDSANRVKSIKDDSSGREAWYLYNEAGQITKQWLQASSAGGIAQYVTYDAAGRLTELSNEKPDGTVLQHYRCQYDANGNLTRIDEPETGNWSAFAYDVQNQLVQERNGHGSTTTATVVYTYDEVGNRTSVTRNGDTTNYTYDAEHNRLIAIDGVGLTYDAAGNVTDDGSATFTWDDANRLSGYREGTTSVTFTYDGLGRRREMTANGSTIVYHWDGDKLAYTANPDGTPIARFTYDPQGSPLMMGIGAQMYYYQLNAHGDIVGLTDASGTLFATYSYDAWGQVESTWEDSSIAGLNPFRYAGYFYDTETGLYYLMARYYRPDLGRFVSVDPVIAGPQPYAYSVNNPMMLVDPSGQSPAMVRQGMLVITAFLFLASSVQAGVNRLLSNNPAGIPSLFNQLGQHIANLMGRPFGSFKPNKHDPNSKIHWLVEIAAFAKAISQAGRTPKQLTKILLDTGFDAETIAAILKWLEEHSIHITR